MMMEGCILLIEDDENDVFLLQYAFKQAGITQPLQVVKDGQQAVDYLAGDGKYADRIQYPAPGLVLLDLKLPLKTGLEVLEWIREQPALQPLIVIVFTSSAQPHDIDQAYRLGANSYVVKPSDTEKRLEVARLLKAWWLDYNSFPRLRAAPASRAH